MRNGNWLWSLVALVGVAGAAAAAEVRIAPDRMLEVDGRRLFVIGLYENPQDDAVLDEVARAGFNLVRASEDQAALDRLRAHGLYAWLNTGGRIDLGSDREARERRLQEMVVKWGPHPALLVWEVPDEALWTCWLGAWNSGTTDLLEMARDFKDRATKLCAGMVAGYEALKRLDSNHPVWINHAAGNSIEDLAAFGRGADIVGCDMYPVMPYPTRYVNVSRRLLASVGLCTMRMQVSAPGKPVWMVLQGTGWVDFDGLFGPKNPAGQRPTFEESRFMAYDVIVRGARAVLYWGTHYTEKDSQLWQDLMKIARELADLQPVLSAPDASVVPDVPSGVIPGLLKDGVRVLGKQTDSGIWWLIVNEAPIPLPCAMHGLAGINGARYTDTVSGRELTISNGTLSLTLPGFGVRILKPVP